MVCISCSYKHNEKFCPNCGEKTGVPKITFSSTVETTFATITNMDKGFLYNLKNLTLKPKETIEEYLKGKRKGIFNPISFLLISVSLYLIVESYFNQKSFTDENDIKLIRDRISYKIASQGAGFIVSYFKYFWALTIIPLSIISKLVYKKYNYLEHITINAFIIGQITLTFGIISFLIFKHHIILNIFIYLALIWFNYRVFNHSKNKLKSFLNSLLVVSLFILSLISLIIIIGSLAIN